MESIYGELRGVFEFAEPETAHEKLYCLFTAKTTLIRYYLAGNNDCRILWQYLQNYRQRYNYINVVVLTFLLERFTDAH